MKLKLFLILLLAPFYAFLYKIYIPRSTAFGCFDDCFNIVGGFFIQNGKRIYSDFFFNHQPFPAFISAVIQDLTKPNNIYELILRHHQFILFFGMIFYVLLILRFGIKALIFGVVFELSKFYFFGDRFLAESYIVYPLIYLLGVALLSLTNKKIYAVDLLISAIFCWFVGFSREPYVPLALFLFIVTIYKNKDLQKQAAVSTGIFVILSLITLLFFNLPDYLFNTVMVNLQIVLPKELAQQIYGGPLEMLFYPMYILFEGSTNILRFLLIGIDILFLSLLFREFKSKNYKLTMFLFITLFLANLRPNTPAKPFYESFHMTIWFSYFIFSTIFLFFRRKKEITYISGLYLFIIFSIFVLSPTNFIYEKINQQEQLITNYGPTLQEGEVIRALLGKHSTVFLDGSDDLIYWQAKKLSPYKYTWYTSVMPELTIYNQARNEMFTKNPPDLYRGFGDCKIVMPTGNARFVNENYARLLNDGKPSCLFIKKDKLKYITEQQKTKISELHYFIAE